MTTLQMIIVTGGYDGSQDVSSTEVMDYSGEKILKLQSDKDTPTCLHTMYAENQTKWLSEYLQAELTIVSTSQTKHLIPCFQYEFDIQQYSTTPGGQC